MGKFAQAVKALREEPDRADTATALRHVARNTYVISYRGQEYTVPATIGERIRDGQTVGILVRHRKPLSILGPQGVRSGVS